MWILYSLLTAFSLSTSDALTKRVLAARDEYSVAWLRLLFALPVLLASFAFIDIPPLDRTFWLATLCALPLEILAIIFYTRALKISPISLTMPFLALTPLFLIGVSFVVLGERVSLAGGAGILLMAAGSYALNFHKVREDIFAPFKAVAAEKGCRLMIGVACIFSITSTLGKLAIEHSSPVFFGSFYFVLVTLFFTPLALRRMDRWTSVSRKDIVPLAAIGVTYAMMILFHMLALSMTNVAYMISVKRTSLLFSVAFGHFLFQEEKIMQRAVGAGIMLAGFVLIVVYN